VGQQWQFSRSSNLQRGDTMNHSTIKTGLITAICFAAYLLGGGTAAQAFDGWGGYSSHFPWYGYGNNGPAAYALGNIPAPPYFALHPPVYYSHPTPRTYGHSPFACGCDCHGAGRSTAAHRVQANPFIQVKPTAPPAPAEQIEKPVKVASNVLRMANPFYEKQLRVAEASE
jgi:hypothetical protein